MVRRAPSVCAACIFVVATSTYSTSTSNIEQQQSLERAHHAKREAPGLLGYVLPLLTSHGMLQFVCWFLVGGHKHDAGWLWSVCWLACFDRLHNIGLDRERRFEFHFAENSPARKVCERTLSSSLRHWKWPPHRMAVAVAVWPFGAAVR